jgi:N6-L-threonylcarbamoyladenine synthase
MGLGYPGGPALEKTAEGGDGSRFDLPRALLGRKDCDFSFSGLKTAVRQVVEKLAVEKLDPNDISAIADLCASFQRTVGDVRLTAAPLRRRRAVADARAGAASPPTSTWGRLEGVGPTPPAWPRRR